MDFRKFIRLSTDLQHIVSNLLEESSHFNVNDVLVNAHEDHSKLFFSNELGPFHLADFPKRILADFRSNLKESGVNTLCRARGIVYLEINGKHVHSPVLLTPLSLTIDRVQQTVMLQEIEDATFVNPFLVGHFRRTLDLILPEEIQHSSDVDTIGLYLESKGLAIDSTVSVIGNFHHHRFEVLKELEELLEIPTLNPAIGTLFGEESEVLEKIDLSSTNLFPADTDHEAVFSAVETSHVVVQGPPGTGKSQVISNLIGKALHSEQTILVVSEKHSALEVIQAKLGSLGLDKLCYIAGSDRQSHQFLSELKNVWDFFESYSPSTEINLRLSEQYEDHLQMTLNLLNQSELIGGVSFHEFLSLSKGKTIENVYSSKTPSINHFIDNQELFERIFVLGLHKNLSYFHKKTLASESFLAFDQQLTTWQNTLSHLNEIVDISTFDDLSNAMKEAATCQVFENDLFKHYSAVFTPNSKEQKQFYRLVKQYESFSGKLEIGSEWTIYPSIIETRSLVDQLQKGSFLARRSAKKRWKQLSTLPFSEALSALALRQEHGEYALKYEKCLAQFRQLGIMDPANEIAQIQHSIPVFSEEKWQLYSAIPVAHRAKITLHHALLNDFYRELLSTFNMDGQMHLSSFFHDVKTDLPRLLIERKNILSLEQSDLESFRSILNFEQYEALVFGSNYTAFCERYPAFSNFQPNELSSQVSAILTAQASESRLHAAHLLDAVHSRFSAYHTLLNTPANRLSTEQKALKQALKKGKAILVKEFGKSRSHPTLRELFQSEARHWISLLKPIWLSNPSSLANCFPMDQGCFGLVIFDEASQIPIQHALGAIQRSKRVVIAGDEHQMGPSSYFQAGSDEIQDLLHQASYYLPKIPLLHHYRSEHPALISFSNKHFYEGKLRAYPSNSANQKPLTHHFIEGGTFVDRTNGIEAAAIVAHLKTQLTTSKSIGIVAFSEEQLNCIWKALGSALQEKLLEHQENHGGFFKALENVQGDECDALVIGFGYAPNEQGDFHMRFGPMNSANGRKRLNVLLTRARATIDFFCSVQSSDFKLSDNESINLLRQWIAFSENAGTSENVTFPYGLKPRMDGGSIHFSRIQEALPNAREVATLQNVLENRGWSVGYA